MKYELISLPNEQPVLSLYAENKRDKEKLNNIHEQLHPIHLKAVISGLAGTGNPCGSHSTEKGIESLHFHLKLG